MPTKHRLKLNISNVIFFCFFNKFLEVKCYFNKSHCVKSVQIRSFFWSAFSCVWNEYGDLRRKIRARKSSVFRHFSCRAKPIKVGSFLGFHLSLQRLIKTPVECLRWRFLRIFEQLFAKSSVFDIRMGSDYACLSFL